VAIIEISCVEVWREISNYVDGDIDADLGERISEHLKHCDHCLAVVDGVRNVIRLVAGGISFDLPAGFSQRLKQRLSKRYRQLADNHPGLSW